MLGICLTFSKFTGVVENVVGNGCFLTLTPGPSPRGRGETDKTQILERHTGNGRFPAQILFAVRVFEVCLGEPPCRPPGPQGVVEQEAHHVGLGEELGNSGQLPGSDLDLGGVDLVLLLGLPELIDPAKAVRGGKDLQRQIGHQALEPLLMLRRQGELKHRGIWSEDLRQHAGRKPGGQLPAVGRAFIGGQVFTLFEGDGHGTVRVRIHQQVVLGQEAGKEHAVPVLVGHLFDETVHGLFFPAVEGVSELAAVNAQSLAQTALIGRKMGIGFCLPYSELPKGSPRRFFRRAAGLLDCFFQAVPQ